MFITPAVAGGTLYIGSCSGRFYAFDAATGSERWVHETSRDGAPAQFHGDALIAGDRLFVGSDVEPLGHLYAFDRATGRVAWKLASPGGVATQVLGRDRVVYAQTVSGEVWAVEGPTGHLVWEHHTVDPGPARGRQVDPVLVGERLVVAWPSGAVEALDAGTGGLLWRVSLGKPTNTSVVAAGRHVLVGTMDGKLHRLALEDGRALPPIELGGQPFGDLVVTDRCLLVLTANVDHFLSCFDRERGTNLWRRNFASELTTFRPLVLGDTAVVGHKGQLVAVGLADGADAWSCAVDGAPRGLNADEERLYVGTFAGLVVAMPLARCRGEMAAKPIAGR